MEVKKEPSFDNSDKRYLLLVGMGLVALIASLTVVVYYLRLELRPLNSGEFLPPDTSVEIPVSPSPEISDIPNQDFFLSPWPSFMNQVPFPSE